MAVNLLEAHTPKKGALGRRVDDAVADKRRQERKAALRIATAPVLDKPRNRADRLVRPEVLVAAPAVTFAPAKTSPIAPATRLETQPAKSSPANRRAPSAVPASDPMFDSDVEIARQLATPVREVRTSIETPPVAQVAQTPAPVRKYRLTVRGQKVMVAAGFALAVGLGALVGSFLNTGGSAAEQTATVTVENGDSLWSIAAGVSAPGQDLRPVVRQIADLNSLENDVIATGQTLIIPGN